ncbi:MAG TPA: nucleotidyl transferase AbiEii/AbiGii toxin family protein [Smithellaceae bacterium]|nr:nucleotidyl transferase AbiEii/AbiGii toxin family protein [Smithellaceae bacterium]HRV25285.1 nucleotidyl transferase AbiEii/AbiGii toxin family protein [Smithellaceae bacterium]
MINDLYFKQAELLLRILPIIDRESVFALKGGTAINFFVRDLPRISIDIDLAYLPVDERDDSLRKISSALTRIAGKITRMIPKTKVIPRKAKESDLLSGLFVEGHNAIVKIEPNLVIRGFVYPPERRVISAKAIELFDTSVECRILSESELYAGKICAALDRQHPRDLFDILMLLKHGGFNTAARKAFVVYLISHARPMVELLNPGFTDIRPVFETEFNGMTLIEVNCEDLEKAREELIAMIAESLTIEEKQFILSIKEGNPRWELLGIEGIENLPAVKWKLLNIARMSPAKHKKAVQKLRDYLKI